MANKLKRFLKINLLTILTIAGMVSGTITGYLLRTYSKDEWTSRELMYLTFPGDLFLRTLKLLIIPLLMTSVISAVGALDLNLSRKVAVPTMLYYCTTTVLAVILGIVLVVLIKPGVGVEGLEKSGAKKMLKSRVLVEDTFLDIIRNLFPPNLLGATMKQSQTVLIPPENYTDNPDVLVPSSELAKWTVSEEFSDGTNMLGLMVFSIALGVSIGQLGERGKPLRSVFEGLTDAVIKLITCVIWYSPIAIFFLVAGKIVTTESFADLVRRLGIFFLTVLLGLFFHTFVTLPIIYFMCLKKLPFKLIRKFGHSCATAFGTGSSAVTIPITLKIMDKLGFDPRITRFVIPIGATINMDGTALYEAVAVIFIAQLKGIQISFANTVGICITATLTSMGAPSVPQASLIAIVIVLNTIGLGAGEIVNIIAVDWLLDRFRTAVNVISDCMGTSIICEINAGNLDNLVTEEDKRSANPVELVQVLTSDGTN